MIHRYSLAGLRKPLTCLGAGIAAGILLLAAVRPAGAGMAQETDESVLAAIGSRLQATVGAGYAEGDAAKAVSIYTPDAKIVGYILGISDVTKTQGFIERDLARHRVVRAEIQNLTLVERAGGEATVSFRFPMQMIKIEGDASVVRNDQFFMKLHFEAGQWWAFLQSYRPDFGMSQMPHTGPAGGADAPQPAPAPEPPAKGTTEL